MAYIAGNENKLLDDQDPMGQSTGDMTSQTFGDQSFTPTAPGATGGQNQQSSLVNPGSVGGSTGTGAGGASPAWTNIQSYLKANPQQSPVVTGFADQADKAVDLTKDQFNTYMDSRKNFDQGSQYFQDFSQTNPNNISQALRAQMSPKPNNLRNQVAPIQQFINADFGSMGFQQYQPGEEYKTLQGIAETPQGFQSYVNDSYDQSAGRPLTQGQRALQNQIDLSGGAFADVRQTALEKLSGISDINDQAMGLNESYASDMSNLQNWQSQANQLKNQYRSSDDLYTRKFGDGRWDPEAQRAGEQAFYQGAVAPSQQATRDFFDQIIAQEGPGKGWNHQTVLGFRPDMRAPYEAVMRGVGQGGSPDAYQAQLMALANIASATGRTPDQSGFTDIGKRMKDSYLNYIKNNNDTYRETFF